MYVYIKQENTQLNPGAQNVQSSENIAKDNVSVLKKMRFYHISSKFGGGKGTENKPLATPGRLALGLRSPTLSCRV